MLLPYTVIVIFIHIRIFKLLNTFLIREIKMPFFKVVNLKYVTWNVNGAI